MFSGAHRPQNRVDGYRRFSESTEGRTSVLDRGTTSLRNLHTRATTRPLPVCRQTFPWDYFRVAPDPGVGCGNIHSHRPDLPSLPSPRHPSLPLSESLRL